MAEALLRGIEGSEDLESLNNDIFLFKLLECLREDNNKIQFPPCCKSGEDAVFPWPSRAGEDRD